MRDNGDIIQIHPLQFGVHAWMGVSHKLRRNNRRERDVNDVVEC